MEKKLKELIDKAYRGRENWIKFIEENNLDDKDYVVLFPESGTEINKIAVKYVNKLALTSRKILVLTYDEALLNLKNCEGNVKVIRCEREQAEEIMQFYSLYQFTDRLIIVSLKEPEGRCGENLVGVNGLTFDEIVAIGIFGMKEA
ncbi:MAG: hypothetical protein E7270_04055 [Lachnospiraceae bacterium]|nr:hypothetical protein [Lachnospiraceae bacterium]